MTPHIVYGRNPVLECLRVKRRRTHRLLLLEGIKGIDEILRAADALPVETASRKDLDRLAKGGVHQGVVLECDPLPLLPLTEFLDRPPPDDAVLVLLDSLTDPQNVGAIARTAVAFGATGLVTTKDRAVPITPALTKAAAGAMEHIDLIQVTNLVDAMKALKEHGFWIAALDPEGDQTIWDADLRGRIGIVVGAEGQGLRRLVRERCDHRLAIPLSGPMPSLNASVSAAIALAECARQRGATR